MIKHLRMLLMRMKGSQHPAIGMRPTGKRPTSLEALNVPVLMTLLVVMTTTMIEDPVINEVTVRDLHPLAITVVEGEDTMMIGNLILGVMSVRDLHPLTMLTREVDMSIARGAQEHLQDLIGMMDAGNGKIHLVEITVMIDLALEGSIQHDLLCLLLHPQMLVWCLLG